MSTDFKKNKINRSASLKAARKQKSIVASTPSEYVKAERAALEYNIIALEAELAMLNSLSEMNDSEKFHELFDLFDKNKDGLLDVSELADGLRKLDDELTFLDSIECAINDMARFDSMGTGKMTKKDFQRFIDVLVGAMDCTFHELSELLVMKVFFANNHNSLEEQLTSESLSEELCKVVLEKEDDEGKVNPTLVVVLNPA